ncbi:MAG: hypothetical protein WCK89_17225, partial [bacterium]
MQAEKGLSLLWLALLNNGYWKLLSLVIAVLIYFTIRADISHVRVITIPVETEFDSGAGGAAIETVEPLSLQVTVRGSYSEVSQLVASTVRCIVRPKQKKNTPVDTVEIKLGHSNLRGVSSVRVAKIEPSIVVVKFDVPMSLRLAVAPPALAALAAILREARRSGRAATRRQIEAPTPAGARTLGYTVSILGEGGAAALFFADITDALAEERRAAEA